MTFSIRDLLALVLLFALGMLAWRTWEDARRERKRLAQLQNEIQSLEASLRMDQPALHQAILRTRDELESLDAMRAASLEHFEVLRKKYSTLAPQGDNTFSLRGLPSLATDAGLAPVLFRLWVPEKRPVWLKFGVHPAQRSVPSPDDDHDLLSDSPFGDSGPFEAQLQSGDQTLTIAIGSAQSGSLPLRVTLGDKVLLRTSFVSPAISGTGVSHTSALSQLDFVPQQELPWLLTATMSLSKPATEKELGFSVWLSDHASNFKTFPGDRRNQQAPHEPNPHKQVPVDTRR